MIQLLKIIAAVSVSRTGLFVINLILLVLTVFLLYDTIVIVRGHMGTISQIDDLTDNIATIMVAFGVLIEERHEVLKLIGSTSHAVPEDNLSDISLRYGVYFIIVGLFIEVFVEAMKIPIRFFEGGLLEETLIAGSILLSGSGLVASALFARDLLFRIIRNPSATPEP